MKTKISPVEIIKHAFQPFQVIKFDERSDKVFIIAMMICRLVQETLPIISLLTEFVQRLIITHRSKDEKVIVWVVLDVPTENGKGASNTFVKEISPTIEAFFKQNRRDHHEPEMMNSVRHF